MLVLSTTNAEALEQIAADPEMGKPIHASTVVRIGRTDGPTFGPPARRRDPAQRGAPEGLGSDVAPPPGGARRRCPPCQTPMCAIRMISSAGARPRPSAQLEDTDVCLTMGIYLLIMRSVRRKPGHLLPLEAAICVCAAKLRSRARRIPRLRNGQTYRRRERSPSAYGLRNFVSSSGPSRSDGPTAESVGRPKHFRSRESSGATSLRTHLLRRGRGARSS